MDMAQGIGGMELAAWLYLLLLHGRFWRLHFLPNTSPPSSWPSICIIVPARNEAQMLPSTLPSLLALDYPGLRVVLVDDQSEDGTTETAIRIAQQHGAAERLTVVRSTPRPGWKGKVSAMQCGLEHVASSGTPPHYVLFTDADIAYDRDALKPLVAQAEANRLVLTSLMVKLRCESKAERRLIPAFVYFFQMLYPFGRASTPQHRLAAAAGGCMLVRHNALTRAGGLMPIRTALIDDCALGRMLKKQGPIWLGLTQDVRSVRAYPTLGDIRAMVARTAYDQLGYSPLNLIAALLGLSLLFLSPVLLALCSHGTAHYMGIAGWACMGITFLPLLRFYGRSPFMAAALPLIAACYMGFTLDSALQYARGKGGLWKGRAQASAAAK